MALRLSEIEADATFIDTWPEPQRFRFMGSEALDILKRELARYFRQEVTGRSFFIAGHRGIGKTALVRRAVEELDAEMRRGVLARATPQAAGGSGPAALRRPQRPLLVKVHGARAS